MKGVLFHMDGSESTNTHRQTTFDLRSRQYLLLTCSPIFDVEVTNRCNLNCVMCPRHAISRPMGLMDTKTFEQILEKCPAGTHLEFCGMGEPLLHPKLFDFMDLLKRRNDIATGLTTNGVLLTRENAGRLAGTAIEMITVSVNGFTAKVYETIMHGAKFNTVVSQLEYLLKSKNDLVKVIISVTASKMNRHEVDALRDFWMVRGAHAVRITRCHSRAGNLCDEGVIDFVPPPKEPLCGIFSRIYFVAWTGDVLTCCHDLGAQAVIGNLHQDDLNTLCRRKLEILRSSRLFPMCTRCDDELRYGLLGAIETSTHLL